MADRTKPELVADADAAGIEGAEEMKKDEIVDALEAKAPPELGPVIPEGQTAPEPPKSSGSPTVGVQPMTEDDIPEAGR